MKIRLAGKIVRESVVDGEGLRLVVFLQGCSHHCEGCQNPQSWDFNGGVEYKVSDLADEIRSLLTPLHAGITLSGGDPLYQAQAVRELLINLLVTDPRLNVWMYTGYTKEEIFRSQELLAAVQFVDRLVEGRFILSRRNLSLPFRGSDNQRIIDVPAELYSLAHAG